VELVRQWLLGVTCASLMAALAEGLMPKGQVRQVGRLVCALVILCAVLRPVLGLRAPDPGQLLADLRGAAADSRMQLEQDSGQMLKTLIERECTAYIVDKAAELGADCQAQVECVLSDGGLWLPDRARVSGQLSGEQKHRLTAQIHSGLGISPDRLVYAGGE